MVTRAWILGLAMSLLATTAQAAEPHRDAGDAGGPPGPHKGASTVTFSALESKERSQRYHENRIHPSRDLEER